MKLDREKLIRARELLGYGIETTAEAAGVSKNSVLRAEHEEDIRPVTARKIAAALEVEVRDLFPLGQAPPPLEEREAGPKVVTGSMHSKVDARTFEILVWALTGEILDDLEDEDYEAATGKVRTLRELISA